MPGMKDYLSIRNDDGKREHVQKRLILSNLKELYELFKERHPDCRVGFSKFASLRPQHCVLAGSSGTHTICVCSIHQNVKLMMLGCNLAALTEQLATPLLTHSDCLKIIICQNPTSDCFFYNCDKCPGIQTLKDLLLNVLEENGKLDFKSPYELRDICENFIRFCRQFL
ncbi:uncharacterized protein LOC123263411 [Cotesia glomerata]|uniref:uncharacterized protein LOC123263411 n=1 Tax=Cotesia glomerata TaxID=32391 RepID=UPI001D00D69A|nr:uncharacterized protein LOC123263411 [Cotesia glomerata]